MKVPPEDKGKPRKRACVACQHCRGKCDGDAARQIICSRCRKFGYDCVLPAPKKMGRPRKTPLQLTPLTLASVTGSSSLSPQSIGGFSSPPTPRLAHSVGTSNSTATTPIFERSTPSFSDLTSSPALSMVCDPALDLTNWHSLEGLEQFAAPQIQLDPLVESEIMHLYFNHVQTFLPILPDYQGFMACPLKDSVHIKFAMGALVLPFWSRPTPHDFIALTSDALEVQLLSPLERVVCLLLLTYAEYGNGRSGLAAQHLRNAAVQALTAKFDAPPPSPVVNMPVSSATSPTSSSDQLLSETRYRCWCEIWAADILAKIVSGPNYMSCWGQSLPAMGPPRTWIWSSHPRENHIQTLRLQTLFSLASVFDETSSPHSRQQQPNMQDLGSSWNAVVNLEAICAAELTKTLGEFHAHYVHHGNQFSSPIKQHTEILYVALVTLSCCKILIQLTARTRYSSPDAQALLWTTPAEPQMLPISTLHLASSHIVQLIRGDLNRNVGNLFHNQLVHNPFHGSLHLIAVAGLTLAFEDSLKRQGPRIQCRELAELLSNLDILEGSLQRQEGVWFANKLLRERLTYLKSSLLPQVNKTSLSAEDVMCILYATKGFLNTILLGETTFLLV